MPAATRWIRTCGNAGSAGDAIVSLAASGAPHVPRASISIPFVATAMLRLGTYDAKERYGVVPGVRMGICEAT